MQGGDVSNTSSSARRPAAVGLPQHKECWPWCTRFATVREALASCGRASLRQRALPAEAMVYYVVALGLFRSVSAREVLRCLMEGLRWAAVGVVVRYTTRVGEVVDFARGRVYAFRLGAGRAATRGTGRTGGGAGVVLRPAPSGASRHNLRTQT